MQGECPERFVGAVAIVRYAVKRRNGKPAGRAAIREYVTVLAQSSDLPDRAPFSRVQKLVNGVASNLQVFGYDESGVKEPDRLLTRLRTTRTSWVSYHQGLFVDGDLKAFAVVDWRHTVERIAIVRIYAPPPPASNQPGEVRAAPNMR